MSNDYNKAPELTAEKAYKLYNQDGKSYQEIADEFSNDEESISHVTVRNRVMAYDDGKSSGIDEVTSNPESYDLQEAIDDESKDHNPYNTASCPACDNEIETPNTPGKHECPKCGKVLNWDESEI